MGGFHWKSQSHIDLMMKTEMVQRGEGGLLSLTISNENPTMAVTFLLFPFKE